MNLFLLLAVISATCASNSAQPVNPPPYAESFKAIVTTEKILTDEILSMAEKLPHLNDSRRHYAEITYVISHLAIVMARNCSQMAMEDLYDKLVDEAASVAISNPILVVEITKKYIDDLNAKTDAIQKLIYISCAYNINERDCNVVLHNFILNDPQKYQKEAELLLSAGGYAKTFNSHANKFNYLAKELEAHKYVINRPVELINLIISLTNFISHLNPNNPPC